MMHSPTPPRLTIAIPTLNRAHCLARTIESALAQAYEGLEVIVSDNGSTDGTADVIARYHDPRLRTFRHQSTMSPQAHGNFLLDEARGEFFLGLSDDDYIDPDFALLAIRLYDRHPELSFLYAATIIHVGDVQVPALHGPEIEGSLDFISAFFGHARNVCWCACVTRVRDLRAIGPIPPDRFIGDMYYWCKIAFQGSVGCIQKPVAHYTFMTADNMTGGIPVPAWAHEVQCLADESLALFLKSRPDETVLRRLRRSMRRFVALSVANQFVWTSIRNTPRRQLALAMLKELPNYWNVRGTWPRIVASLILPVSTLRWIVFRQAAQLATANRRMIRNWRGHRFD